MADRIADRAARKAVPADMASVHGASMHADSTRDKRGLLGQEQTVRQVGQMVQQGWTLSAGHAVDGSSIDGGILPLWQQHWMCAGLHILNLPSKGECHGLGSQPKITLEQPSVYFVDNLRVRRGRDSCDAVCTVLG